MSQPGFFAAVECWMPGGLPAGLAGCQPDWAVAAAMAVAAAVAEWLAGWFAS